MIEGLDPVTAKMNDPGPVLAGNAGRGGKGRIGDEEQQKQRKTAHGRKHSAFGPGKASNRPNRGIAVTALGVWSERINFMAGVEGLEPPTPGFGDRCSTS